MRVGTSQRVFCVCFRSQDHPHACGDKLTSPSTLLIAPGSSPCVWGQVCPFLSRYKNVRIIPMRVGTRADKVHNQTVHEDHPHACGDKNRRNSPKYTEKGSSPCVWGQANTKNGLFARLRIIPMRVGTSGYDMEHKKDTMDHPHACGDKNIIVRLQMQAEGSSPCVWGQVFLKKQRKNPSGIIPMRVGTS